MHVVLESGANALWLREDRPAKKSLRPKQPPPPRLHHLVNEPRREKGNVPSSGQSIQWSCTTQPACSFLLTDSLRGHRARPTIRRSTRREFVSASQICPPPISRSGMIIRPFRPATVGSLSPGGEIHVHIEDRMMDRYVSVGRMIFECRSIQTGHPFHSWRRNYCVDVISCPCYSSPT